MKFVYSLSNFVNSSPNLSSQNVLYYSLCSEGKDVLHDKYVPLVSVETSIWKPSTENAK